MAVRKLRLFKIIYKVYSLEIALEAEMNFLKRYMKKQSLYAGIALGLTTIKNNIGSLWGNVEQL